MAATKDQVAQIIVGEAKARNHTRDECLAELSALYQESEFDETVWDPTRTTYGVAQQDASYPNRFLGAAAQVKAFFDKLDVKRTSPGHGDIWLNICWLQQAPNYPSAQFWWDNPKSRRAYLTEIKSRIATVTPYLDRYWPTTSGEPQPMPNRPDFNEINQIGWDAADPHGSKRTQLPRNWLLHTQEGDGNAETLASYLRSTKGSAAVSYHYTGHEDLNDHGVTVCDVIDTDLYSWSVLNANVFTINFCYAASYAGWNRATWLARCRNVIRVSAYLAVEDAKKYPTIAAKVIPPPYASTGPGFSDHRWVTQALGIGTHTDLGDGYPWDVFEDDVDSFLAVPANPDGPSAPPPAVDTTPIFAHPTTDVMVAEIWDQLRGPQGKGWTQDGNRTPVETIWALGRKAGI